VDVTIPNDADDGITADGEYSVTATVTDAAGNVSAPSNAVSFTVDTAAPGQPTVIIGNGDDLVNGFDLNDDGLVEVTVVLPDNAEVGDTVTVDGMPTPITQDMLDNGYNFAVEVPSQGAVLTVTANVTDQAGNVGSIGTDSATVGDTTAPAVLIPEALDGVNAEEFADGIQTQVTLPSGTVAGDTVTLTVTPDAGNPITVEYEVTAADLDVNDGDGIAEITIPNGVDGISDNGAYTVVATVTDANENVSAPSAAVEFDLNTTFTARDDLDDLDLGALQVTYYDPISESDLDVLGVAEGTGGADSSLGFTVSAGTNGTVSIEVSQTALVTVADAINIEVYNSNNELVYVGTTGSEPLVGNVIGIELLGLTGNDTLTATVSDLEPDEYTIVVRNSESALGALVNGLTLAELGEAGVVLGPDNQEVVFTTINNALGPVLGGTVNGLLNIALTAAGDEGLGLDAVVDILEDNVLGLGVLDPLLDDITAVLLSNTLTLLETTDITATVTEFDYADDTVITGNVIDPDVSSSGELGEDTVTVDTVLTDIDSNDSQSEPTSAVVDGTTVFTIQGQYGVLVIDENGDYTYTANGDFASSGQSETFTYTVSDGVISDIAELAINLDAVVDMTPPEAPTIDEPIAGDNIVNGTEAAASFAVTGTGVSGDTITLTDGSNNILGTAIVDAAGDWSINVDEAEVRAMGEGAEQLSATATDPAGNIGAASTVTVTVDTTSPVAVDDQNLAELEVTSTVSTSTAGLNGDVNSLLGIGVLNGLVDVDFLEENNVFEVSVEAGNTQVITLDGSGSQLLSLSAVLGGNNNFNLEIYRQENGSDLAELVQLKEDFLGYSPGLFGAFGSWSADALTLDTFTGGVKGAKYFIVATNPAANDGLLSLGLLTDISIGAIASTLTDYTVTGEPVLDNVIENDDGIGQSITVTAINGDPINGSTTIDGDYGTLVISSNGDYAYTPFKNNSVIGQTDDFDYTINDGNGNTDTATLSITINSDGQAPAAARMSATSFTLADDTASIELPDTLLTTSSEGVDTLSFEGSDQIISLSDMMQPDIIDIGGIGANTLNIADKDVETTIYVKGDNDDTVNLEGDSWTNIGQTTSEGEMYNVWQSSNDTQVHIDTDIVNII
ncbi:Ig-like domain-containing protein, partial [Psychrobacter sp. PP-21]|uniref:beta strand repeat-containing protein n=1 Tax=Psychrobacter sp. PP-21 TaxID=2957503 RepID=UPI0029B0B042